MIELHSLLGLIHSILSGEEVEDGVAQLNDIFEEEGFPRLTKSSLYYTGDSTDEPCYVKVEKADFSTLLEKKTFKAGLRESYGAREWECLDEVDTDFLATNEENHPLFDTLSEKEIRDLLGPAYEDYLEARGEIGEEEI